jgi:mono/diheme cytochrome c family protein
MNEDTKKLYKERYMQAKQHGVKFWPDIIYKDLIASALIFVLLVLLATFLGIAAEPKADPSDSSYLPRPEWYFLFLFKFLAIYGQIPILGKIEFIATTVIPGLAVGLLFLLPFLDRSPNRHFSKRGMAIAIMTLLVVTIVALTLIADISTDQLSILQFLVGIVLPGLGLLALVLIPILFKRYANRLLAWTTGILSVLILALAVTVMVLAVPPEATEEVALAATLPEQILLGQDLYGVHCVECHGAEGEGGEIIGVEGMEGVVVKAINSQDEMYTRTDETLFGIIAYGQPNLGMPPFGRAYGGELGTSEIDYIVNFMRYTWDDRAELPAEVAAANTIPALGPDEVPSFNVHIQPIVKRYCVSCHREGKKNNNYFMTSYAETINSGDNAPVMVAGDLESLLILMIHRVEDLEEGGPMPPTRALKPELVEIFERWVMAGMPETPEQAAELSGTGSDSSAAPTESLPYPAPANPLIEVTPTPYP